MQKSKYKIGDLVIIGNNRAQIVKVIEDINIENTLYLLQDLNKNEFIYELETQMSGSEAGDNPSNKMNLIETHESPSNKRQKPNSVISTTPSESLSSKSTSYARNWYKLGQNERFNLKFEINTLEQFFEDILEMIYEDDNDDVKELANKHWSAKTATSKSSYDKLVRESHAFQFSQSEADTSNCVKTICDIFDLNDLSYMQILKFGRADMLIHEENQFSFKKCVIENKGGGPYNLDKHIESRSQLAAYIISIAIDNSKALHELYNKNFGHQTIFGILHMGLTCIFFKSNITDKYLQSIKPLYDKSQNEEVPNIPSLIIKEFTPTRPYCDRELLNIDSRPTIFKSYRLFKKLMDFHLQHPMSVMKK